MSRIVLFVMTQKGYEVTKRLVENFSSSMFRVVIGRDASVINDFSLDIRALCEQSQIQYSYRADPTPVKDSDYIFAISWRWMINHPENKLIVFHDSILPKYRGFAPLVNSLINGERQIGVTAIFGATEYDRGDLVGQKKIEVYYPIKIQQAIELNMNCFLDLAVDVAKKIFSGKDLQAVPQVERNATYSIWRDNDDYYIDWTQNSEKIARLVDAVGYPYLGARSKISNGTEVIIDDVELVEDVVCEQRDIGKIVFLDEGCPIVICGEGLLKIKKARVVNAESEKSLLPLKSFRLRFYR